jgi:hypothetical protein
MEDKPEYNLDFHQAIDILLNNGCVKGENFANGVFLKLSFFGNIVTCDAEDFYKESNFIFLKALANQKYREVNLMTVKELSK